MLDPDTSSSVPLSTAAEIESMNLRQMIGSRNHFLALVMTTFTAVVVQQSTGQTDVASRLLLQLERLRGKGIGVSTARLRNDIGTCGLRVRFEIERHWNEFTEGQRERIQEILDPSPMEVNRIMGHFKIFYDTSESSPNVPALIYIDANNIAQRIPGTAEAFVDSVGKYFNYVWSYEVDTLGYTQPPLDTDGYYHVYIIDLSYSGIYGETFWDAPPINTGQPPRYRTYIMIDKDFSTVYPPTRGIPALKVTAAHELQHAIHIGSYGVWTNDFYYYELTATWMEQVVFHEVKDYIQYFYQYDPNSGEYVAGGQFATPDVSFTAYSGLIEFSRCIWGCYLQKRFSRDIIRRTWEYMRTIPSLSASDAALNEQGSSLRQAFLEWSLWNLNTGPNADTTAYYPDGRLYPAIEKRPDVSYDRVPRSFADTIQALSSAYHPICLLDSSHPTCNTSSKMVSIISNLNSNASGDGMGYGFRYDISPTGDQSYKPLGNGIFVRLTAPDPANWSSQEIETDSGSLPTPIIPKYADILVCPDPFYPSGNRALTFGIPADSTNQTSAFLSVFSSSMDEIISQKLPLQQTPCGNGIQWNGHSNRGDIIATGVYLYVITVNGNRYLGKFSVIRK